MKLPTKKQLFNAALVIPIFLLLSLTTSIAFAGLAEDILDEVQKDVNDLMDRTSGIKTRTVDTLEEVRFITDTFKGSLEAISAEVSDSVRYGYEDLNTILENNREGLADFLNVDSTTPTPNSPTSFNFEAPSRANECSAVSPCGIFRDDMKTLLLLMENLLHSLTSNNVSGVDLDINFGLMGKVIDQLPSRALFPMYRVMVTESSMLSEMQLVTLEATGHLDIVADVLASDYFAATSNQAFPQEIYNAHHCQAIIDNYSGISLADDALTFYSIVYKILGKSMIGIGNTMIKFPDLSGGFAEFANIHVSVESNDPKAFGSFLDGMSDALSTQSNAINQKITNCTSLRAQLNILDTISNINGGGSSSNNQAVLDGQADILAQQQSMIEQQQQMIDHQLSILSAISDIDQSNSSNQELLDGQADLLDQQHETQQQQEEIIGNQETIINAVVKNKHAKK